MANMELITSVTVGSGGAASVTLPATGTIPQTYTDLQLVVSSRMSNSNVEAYNTIRFNASTSNYSGKYVVGDGASASSGNSPGSGVVTYTSGASTTSSTFGSYSVYIPNYTSSNYKSFSIDAVSENNATTAYAILNAGLWSDVSAITSIVLNDTVNSANFVSGSTFYLYGISNVTSGSKATGGIVSSDGTYWYHMFPYSGTFTPTTAISADILVIAGGGGGPSDIAGGGGAGGLLTFTSQSLTATGYTCTVGAGGSSTSNGVDSQFGALTLVKGGGKGGNADGGVGASGGSGGGGGGSGGTSAAGGSPTSGQGNTGGANFPQGGAGPAGGGGGAGAVGGAASSSTAGNGGIGATSSLINAIATATGTGQSSGSNYYYAGGGGGSTYYSVAGTGGLGGGGNGTTASGAGIAGKPNTGGGGGSGINTGAAGGSGLIVIRYAI